MKSTSRKKKVGTLSTQLSRVNPNAAGIDIGSSSHFVAVPLGRDEESVREFKSFTSDLYALADWLAHCGIKTVAMESTGVYWIPLFEILEARGFDVQLCNPKHLKNVPGRGKSDVIDCQWIQKLHSFGLLSGSFRPDEHICELRAYTRQRDGLVKSMSSHIHGMQKALSLMNIQLHNVLSDITGETGFRIIRAIVAGERCVKKLAKFRDKRCKNSIEVIEKSLEGNYRAEHLFKLRQELALYDTFQERLLECDKIIEECLSRFEEKIDITEKPLIVKARKKRRKNELYFEAREYLYKMSGVDLTLIDGLDSHSILKLIGETGLDMNRWPTDSHFSSWLGLAPGTKISGGKRLSGKTKPSANRAAEIFRVAAFTLSNSHSALGAFFRRMKTRLGAPKAITATAHKIARLFYIMLRFGKEYKDDGAKYYEEKYRSRIIRNMQTKAAKFGFSLVPLPEIIVDLNCTNCEVS
jgi:transposase